MLLAITALAASKIVCVERKFCSNRIVVTLGKARSNSKMLRMSAPRQRYTDWSESPTTHTLPCAAQELDDLVLCVVRVLELVDQDVLEALLELLSNVVGRLQQVRGDHE